MSKLCFNARLGYFGCLVLVTLFGLVWGTRRCSAQLINLQNLIEYRGNRKQKLRGFGDSIEFRWGEGMCRKFQLRSKGKWWKILSRNFSLISKCKMLHTSAEPFVH